MITGYDYAIIAFYLLFMLGLGLFFRRLSKNTSDYFRAGGAMPWWITGISAWIASFSAWTFTGAAGKIYQTGTLVLCLYYSAIFPLAIVLIYTSFRFRRMRVVTWMEAVRNRYGRSTEQVYTWIKLPLLLVTGGVGLNAIGVFMSATFHVPLVEMLIILGAAVTIVASVGGAFGVLASDFVQMLLVVGITILASFPCPASAAGGGRQWFDSQHVPSSFFNWTELARAPFIVVWTLSLTLLKIFEQNGMENSTMFLMVKNDRDARRMVLIPLIGTLIGPLIWMIPPMTARITHPHLAAEYPQMVVPSEAAFVAVCRGHHASGIDRATDLRHVRRDAHEHGRSAQQRRRRLCSQFLSAADRPAVSGETSAENRKAVHASVRRDHRGDGVARREIPQRRLVRPDESTRRQHRAPDDVPDGLWPLLQTYTGMVRVEHGHRRLREFPSR